MEKEQAGMFLFHRDLIFFVVIPFCRLIQFLLTSTKTMHCRNDDSGFGGAFVYIQDSIPKFFRTGNRGKPFFSTDPKGSERRRRIAFADREKRIDVTSTTLPFPFPNFLTCWQPIQNLFCIICLDPTRKLILRFPSSPYFSRLFPTRFNGINKNKKRNRSRDRSFYSSMFPFSFLSLSSNLFIISVATT